MTNEEKAKLLKPEDVAHELMVSERTVRRWLREGKLRGVKVGRAWRVRPEIVEEFIEGNWGTEKRELIIHINPGIPLLYVEDRQTQKDLGMPDEFWKKFASMIPKNDSDWEDVADMIRNALQALQVEQADIGTERVAIICHSYNEVAWIAKGSDQPAHDGPCPICRSDTCDWQLVDEYGVEEEGYTTSKLLTIFINNHGKNDNSGILVDGQWNSAARAARKKAGIKE
jgi:excisionase family DNA binding protein